MLISRNLILQGFLKSGSKSCKPEVTFAIHQEKIDPHPELIEHARAAFAKNGVEMRCVPIRGGTDGARLSWDGLPCPNLPTGGYNYHGVREWIPVESLGLMTDVLVDLVHSFAEARV